ncbi:MAG: hypothetical protein AAB879_00035 [Patescibacteria group bacterium]
MTSPLSFIQILLAIFVACVFAILVFLFVGWPQKIPGTVYGVTWSRHYASELGLDPDATLASALDEIGIRRFRLPAYWGLLEIEKGRWDFSSLDREIAEIDKRNGKVILAIGEKLPRWPECWGPAWWKKLPLDRQRPLTLAYLETVVSRYRKNPTVVAWQVENEPYFRYGDCPAPDHGFIKQEISLIRRLDPSRKIFTTDSGELSLWMTLGSSVDTLGVSVYRVVRNPLFGDWNFTYWWLPPYFYQRKATLVRLFGVKEIYVSEFQMEPWSHRALRETPLRDQLRTMDAARMKSHFSFAERMGVSAIDFWGIEWWYWMKEKQAHPEFVEEAKRFWNSTRSR